MREVMKNVVSKILVWACVCCLLVGICPPVPAKAASNLNSNSQIDIGSHNLVRRGVVKMTVVQGTEGTATYDPENNMLILDNYKSIDLDVAVCVKNIDNFTIKIIGDVVIGSYSSDGIYAELADSTLNIVGEEGASLTIENRQGDEFGEYGIFVNCNVRNRNAGLNISDLKLNIRSYGRSIGADIVNINRCSIISSNLEGERADVYTLNRLRSSMEGCLRCQKLNINNSSLDLYAPKLCALAVTDYADYYRDTVEFPDTDYYKNLGTANLDSEIRVTSENGGVANLVYTKINDKYLTRIYSAKPLNDANHMYSTYDDVAPLEHIYIKTYHNIIKNEAVAPTCTETGSIEYYSCTGCGACFRDAEATIHLLPEMTVIPVDPANHLAGQPVVENTVISTSPSQISYDSVIYCVRCGAEMARVRMTEAIPVDESVNTGTEDVSGQSQAVINFPKSKFRVLQAKASSVKKKSVKLSWKRVKSADGYLVYGNKCKKNGQYKLLKAISNNKKTSYTKKKLKKKTDYRFMVASYKMVDGNLVITNVSKPVYVTTAGGKYGNIKSLKTNRTKTIRLKKGKSAKIKVSTSKTKSRMKKYRGICFESSNPKIAKVTSKGKIKALKKGKCYIYVYAQNGLSKRIKVICTK